MRDDQLWHYHAYDYAWRRVYFRDRSDTSPADVQGKWFNSALVDAAEEMFRAHYRSPPPTENATFRDAAEYREQWARQRGCADFEDAKKIRLVLVGCRNPHSPTELPDGPPAKEISPP